jgi:hypothetical protein
VIAVQRAYA